MVEPSLYLRRFSCRRFHRDPVEESQLAFILEAARWAPSAGNLQPWRFLVVRDQPTKEPLHSPPTARSSSRRTPRS